MKRMAIFVLWVTGIVCSGASAAHAAGWSDFSADMVMAGAEGNMQAKIYTAGKKSRMEMAGTTVINRADLGLAWVLMPSERMYMEQPIDPQMTGSTAGASSDEVERVSMGKESVEGRDADKSKVTYRGAGGEESVYEWTASGSPVPVKVAAINGSWNVLYRNIKTSPQPASLFEVPAGYQKFAMPNMNQIMAGAYSEN